MAQDSELKLGKVIWIAGHSGPETAEDSRTHFGIFETGVTQLFPEGAVIDLHPWEHNEVPVVLGAALATDVPIVALHLTRPPVPIPDREALGIPSHFEAARGAYVMRPFRDGQPPMGTVFVRGTVPTANVVKILPELDRAGLNVKIVAAISPQLFRLQEAAYREATVSVADRWDAMAVTSGARRLMADWLSGPVAEEYTLCADRDDRWRTGGSVDEVMEEAGLGAGTDPGRHRALRARAAGSGGTDQGRGGGRRRSLIEDRGWARRVTIGLSSSTPAHRGRGTRTPAGRQSMVTQYVALYGDPVEGNPTSRMQNLAFEAAGLDWRYLDIRVRAEDLPAALSAARLLGFGGLNFTIPHKVAVIPLLDGLEPSAEISGACNTVVRQPDGRLIGSNTDGSGFLWSLRDEGIDPAGLDVVLLGAGGAARAVAVELALAGARRITVANRGPAQARGADDAARGAHQRGGRLAGLGGPPDRAAL